MFIVSKYMTPGSPARANRASWPLRRISVSFSDIKSLPVAASVV